MRLQQQENPVKIDEEPLEEVVQFDYPWDQSGQ